MKRNQLKKDLRVLDRERKRLERLIRVTPN